MPHNHHMYSASYNWIYLVVSLIGPITSGQLTVSYNSSAYFTLTLLSESYTSMNA